MPRLPALFVLTLAVLFTGCQMGQPKQSVKAIRPPRAAPDAALRETHWVLRQLAGKAISLPPDTRESFLTLRIDGAAEGNGSCNRFRGSFFSEKPGELKFGPLMSTRMACPAIETENDFTRALSQSQTYRISGDTLRLLDAGGVPVAWLEARLEAVYLR